MIDEEYEARKAKLTQESDKILKDIREFDCDLSSPKDLLALHEKLDEIKEGLEDLINELEVEHFLENGAGGKDKKYEKRQKLDEES
jgi:argonaute-like protein implicated in RNA metabolism and viral defense